MKQFWLSSVILGCVFAGVLVGAEDSESPAKDVEGFKHFYSVLVEANRENIALHLDANQDTFLRDQGFSLVNVSAVIRNPMVAESEFNFPTSGAYLPFELKTLESLVSALGSGRNPTPIVVKIKKHYHRVNVDKVTSTKTEERVTSVMEIKVWYSRDPESESILYPLIDSFHIAPVTHRSGPKGGSSGSGR